MTEETAAPLDIKFQQRFSKNLVSNIIYFVLQFIIGLALVPYFIDSLGSAAYALIPLATSVTSYVIFILDAMNAAISRFLSIDLQRGLRSEANITYNTAFFGVLGIVLILIPVSVIIAFLAPYIFNVGPESTLEVTWFFLLVLLSSLIRAFSAPFTASFVAYNRIDYTNITYSINILAQVLLIVLSFTFLGPSLFSVGVAYFSAALLSTFTAGILFKKTVSFLHIQIHSFSKKKFRWIGDQAFWSVFHTVGELLRFPICLILVNIMFGELAETQFSLGVTICTAILAISSLITSTFRPQIYLYRSKEDAESIVEFGKRSIKLVGLIMALPIALICVFSPQILTIWVGEEFADISLLIWILVVPMLIRTMESCIGPINAAYLKVRPVALMNCLTGIINVLLAISLPLIFNNGIYGVGIAYAVAVILMSAIFQPLYNAHILQSSYTSFMTPMFYGVFSYFILTCILLIVTQFVTVSTIAGLIFSCSLIGILYCIVLRFILSKRDRELIYSLIPSLLRKHIPKWLII